MTTEESQKLPSPPDRPLWFTISLLVVAILLWLWGSFSLRNTNLPASERVPPSVAESVWEVDAGVHRLLSTDEFGGDDVFEVERSKLTGALERMRTLSETDKTFFHDSLDAVLTAASSFMVALESGSRPLAIEHAIKFRDAVVTVENRLTPGLDEQDDQRQDGAGLLFVAGILLMVATGSALYSARSTARRYQSSAEGLAAITENVEAAQEKLVARENELAAVRGRVDELLTDRSKHAVEMENIRSDLQRHMLARSALETTISQQKSSLFEAQNQIQTLQHQWLTAKDTAAALQVSFQDEQQSERERWQRELKHQESLVADLKEKLAVAAQTPPIDQEELAQLKQKCEGLEILRDRMLKRVDELTQGHTAAEERARVATEEAKEARYHAMRLEHELQKIGATELRGGDDRRRA